jgi:AraC family transcriptional regulator
MTIYIKNMVCSRCIMSVEQILQTLSIQYTQVILGEVELVEKLNVKELEILSESLQKVGFELIDSRINILIEKIKKAIHEYLSEIEKSGERKDTLSHFISDKLHYEYSYLSDLFSSIDGMTIENYFIRLRIERAKEWIVYDEKNLTEIAYDLGFSSVHHLSSQFKKVTGLTPTHFKKIGKLKRKGQENI